jgi:hypothetical protein
MVLFNFLFISVVTGRLTFSFFNSPIIVPQSALVPRPLTFHVQNISLYCIPCYLSYFVPLWLSVDVTGSSWLWSNWVIDCLWCEQSPSVLASQGRLPLPPIFRSYHHYCCFRLHLRSWTRERPSRVMCRSVVFCINRSTSNNPSSCTTVLDELLLQRL